MWVRSPGRALGLLRITVSLITGVGGRWSGAEHLGALLLVKAKGSGGPPASNCSWGHQHPRLQRIWH